MTKIGFDTYAGTFNGHEVVYYCFNPKLTSIKEFIEIQYRALHGAAKKKHRLFHKYKCINVDIDDTTVCLN